MCLLQEGGEEVAARLRNGASRVLSHPPRFLFDREASEPISRLRKKAVALVKVAARQGQGPNGAGDPGDVAVPF